MIATAHRVVPGSRDEDRVHLGHHETHSIIVVADGAGGVGGGRNAAELICASLGTEVRSGSTDWGEVLSSIDDNMARRGDGGLATAVIVEVSSGTIRGASVGDSGAWLLHAGHLEDLTEGQNRKPLVGTGAAAPVVFGPFPFRGRLLVASDGLFKYASRTLLMETMSQGTIEDAVDRLVETVRLPNGGLQDDIAVVLAESTG